MAIVKAKSLAVGVIALLSIGLFNPAVGGDQTACIHVSATSSEKSLQGKVVNITLLDPESKRAVWGYQQQIVSKPARKYVCVVPAGSFILRQEGPGMSTYEFHTFAVKENTHIHAHMEAGEGNYVFQAATERCPLASKDIAESLRKLELQIRELMKR